MRFFRLIKLKNHKDEICLFAFFAIFLLSWTLAAGFLPSSTELDSTEEVVWSKSWQWGYYKHPPLPSALLHLLNIVFSGPSLAIIAFASQLCTVTALFFVWLLARKILTNKQAIVAVLITSLIAYHNTRALTFNHNTVSLPFTAAAWYFFYCALQRPEYLRNWFGLGLACGLAMLTKYSALIILATFFIYLSWQRLWFKPYIFKGVLISFAIFICVISPHIVWLAKHNWLPFTYIHNKLDISGNRLVIIGKFWVNQFIRLSFMLPLLSGIWFLCKRNIIGISFKNEAKLSHESQDGLCLISIQFFPLLLAMMPTLMTGSILNSNWVSAFYLPSGILISYFFLKRCNETELLKYSSGLTWVSHGVILVLFFVTALIYPGWQGKAKRLNFPGELLTGKVLNVWHDKLPQQPLTIIVSNTWIGGNLALHIKPEPVVFIDYNELEAPWTNAEDIAACGSFIIINKADYNPLVYTHLFNQAVHHGEFSLIWGHKPLGRTLHYKWAIIPPHNESQACRFMDR